MFGSTGLNYPSSWDVIQFQDNIIPDMDMFLQQEQNQVQQQELLPETLSTDMSDFNFNFNFNFDFDCGLVDPFLQSQEMSYYPNNSLRPECFLDEPESISHFPKRQKLESCNFNPGFDRNLFRMNAPSAPEDVFLLENPIFSDFRVPEISGGLRSKLNCDQINVSDEKKPSLSAQSLAARQRRRKIAEKTQELAKLIPGGQRMNTAEMFQTAAKYVKFLQTQVEILQLIASMEGSKEAIPGENEEKSNLGFLASPAIQEKLASEQICLVPRKFVEAFAADKTNARISEDVNKLLRSNCRPEP